MYSLFLMIYFWYNAQSNNYMINAYFYLSAPEPVQPKTKSGKKMPAGAVSIFAGKKHYIRFISL